MSIKKMPYFFQSLFAMTLLYAIPGLSEDQQKFYFVVGVPTLSIQCEPEKVPQALARKHAELEGLTFNYFDNQQNSTSEEILDKALNRFSQIYPKLGKHVQEIVAEYQNSKKRLDVTHSIEASLQTNDKCKIYRLTRFLIDEFSPSGPPKSFESKPALEKLDKVSQAITILQNSIIRKLYFTKMPQYGLPDSKHYERFAAFLFSDQFDGNLNTLLDIISGNWLTGGVSAGWNDQLFGWYEKFGARLKNIFPDYMDTRQACSWPLSKDERIEFNNQQLNFEEMCYLSKEMNQIGKLTFEKPTNVNFFKFNLPLLTLQFTHYENSPSDKALYITLPSYGQELKTQQLKLIVANQVVFNAMTEKLFQAGIISGEFFANGEWKKIENVPGWCYFKDNETQVECFPNENVGN